MIVVKGISKNHSCFSRFLKSYVCVYQSLCSDRDNSCIFISNGLWDLSHKSNSPMFHDNYVGSVAAAPPLLCASA